MKKTVIAISDETAELSSELISILQNAGIAVRRGRLNSNSSAYDCEEDRAKVVAVVYEVPQDFSTKRLRQVNQKARSLWPAVPLVGCITTGLHRENGLDEIMMCAGFDAVAESSAQLPAVLREVEERSESGELPRPLKRVPDQTAFTLPAS